MEITSIRFSREGNLLSFPETTEHLMRDQEAARLRRLREGWRLGFRQRRAMEMRRRAALHGAFIAGAATLGLLLVLLHILG